ncbi:MAG: Mth938-like domain-containing protein [Burkholderiales bacterium]|nr:Mth938-like domain-containing protein [Burkholderiales bacterium]
MKLHLDPVTGSNVITGHGPGFVAINGGNISAPVIILPDKIINPWLIASPSPSALALCIDDFADVFELKPELVVFGSGALFRFPDRRIMAAFGEARIGFEVMDTPAACRTYNVLMSEGRRIAAALLIGIG